MRINIQLLALSHRRTLARVRSERGMSLVEATIILMILFLLTAVLSPSIGDYIEDARNTKGKEDVEAIGVTISRLQRDIGSCIKLVATTACTMENRVEILRSTGPDVVSTDLGSTAATDFTSTNNITAAINWDDDRATNAGDTLESQFVLNTPDYNTPAETSPTGYTLSGPLAGLGWRGAYMTSPIGTDPWGRVYLVNVVFLAVATDATADTVEGGIRGGWSHDTFVISAGPNNFYDTSFGVADGTAVGAYGTTRQGDDLIYVIRGDTR